MELISRALLLILVVIAAVLLFTPYEAWLEGALALAIVGTVVVGFSMPPRKEIFYVRTSIQIADRNRNPALEHDFLAVKVELARLGLLFLPTFLAVAFLVFFVAGGPTKFSYTNWIFSSPYALIAMQFWHFPPLLALLLLLAWVGERKSNERCRSVQRKVLLYLSRSIWSVWASFLPVYGRTQRILRRRLYVVWADSDP
jgi:hypothetical protein